MLCGRPRGSTASRLASHSSARAALTPGVSCAHPAPSTRRWACARGSRRHSSPGGQRSCCCPGAGRAKAATGDCTHLCGQSSSLAACRRCSARSAGPRLPAPAALQRELRRGRGRSPGACRQRCCGRGAGRRQGGSRSRRRSPWCANQVVQDAWDSMRIHQGVHAVVWARCLTACLFCAQNQCGSLLWHPCEQ